MGRCSVFTSEGIDTGGFIDRASLNKTHAIRFPRADSPFRELMYAPQMFGDDEAPWSNVWLLYRGDKKWEAPPDDCDYDSKANYETDSTLQIQNRQQVEVWLTHHGHPIPTELLPLEGAYEPTHAIELMAARAQAEADGAWQPRLVRSAADNLNRAATEQKPASNDGESDPSVDLPSVSVTDDNPNPAAGGGGFSAMGTGMAHNTVPAVVSKVTLPVFDDKTHSITVNGEPPFVCTSAATYDAVKRIYEARPGFARPRGERWPAPMKKLPDCITSKIHTSDGPGGGKRWIDTGCAQD